MYELHSLGFGPFFANQVSPDSVPGRIASEHRDGYTVWTTEGESFARLSGTIIHGLHDEALPGVGDWVALRALPGPGQTAVIDAVLERRTVFTRGAAGPHTRGQVVAANVDIVFVVTGLDTDYNLRRLERYVARIYASGATPAIILNKADTCDDVQAVVDEIERTLPGLDVHVTSASLAQGLDTVVARISTGVTAAFVGSSGAGKSTLINALLGEERFATSETRSGDGRGRHTTTRRQLVILPSGGLLMDTPGMRELALPDDEGIDAVFPSIEELSANCRFSDCTHQSEPGCAVREAVERGDLPEERLEHYLKMMAEADAFELRHNERLRRRSEKVEGKRRATDLKLIQRRKEGRK